MKLFKWSFHYTALNNKDLLQLCPLYRLLSTPSLDQSNLSLLGFLLPWMWGISSRFLQQSAAAAPYLDEGYLLTAAPPNLEHGIAPLGPPVPTQPLLLGPIILCKVSNLQFAECIICFHALGPSFLFLNYYSIFQSSCKELLWVSSFPTPRQS